MTDLMISCGMSQTLDSGDRGAEPLRCVSLSHGDGQSDKMFLGPAWVPDGDSRLTAPAPPEFLPDVPREAPPDEPPPGYSVCLGGMTKPAPPPDGGDARKQRSVQEARASRPGKAHEP